MQTGTLLSARSRIWGSKLAASPPGFHDCFAGILVFSEIRHKTVRPASLLAQHTRLAAGDKAWDILGAIRSTGCKSALGSKQPFAVPSLNDRYADKADVRNDAASLLLVNDRTAGEAAFEGATTWLVRSDIPG